MRVVSRQEYEQLHIEAEQRQNSIAEKDKCAYCQGKGYFFGKQLDDKTCFCFPCNVCKAHGRRPVN